MKAAKTVVSYAHPAYLRWLPSSNSRQRPASAEHLDWKRGPAGARNGAQRPSALSQPGPLFNPALFHLHCLRSIQRCWPPDRSVQGRGRWRSTHCHAQCGWRKGSSNKRRTAGINEEPPVRKTWSIAPAPMSRIHQRASRIPPNQPEAYVPIG